MSDKKPHIVDAEVLNFSGCDFTDLKAFQELLDVLQEQDCASAQKVDLGAAKFTSKLEFGKLLAAMEKNTSVVELDLSNYICVDYLSPPSNGQPLRQLLQSNKTLQKLDLSGHYLDGQAVRDMAQGLQENSVLRELRLHSCSVDETSAGLLLESALVHDRLEALDLGANNTFSPDFLNTKVVSYLDRSTSIRSLALGHNSSLFDVCDPKTELEPFWKAIERNTTLQSLSFRYCRLKQDAGEALLRALTVNQSITTLDLEFTGFGLRDKGNEILIDLLSELTTLKTLKLYTRYPASSVPRLVKALQENTSLQSFRPRIDGDYRLGQHRVESLLARNQRLSQAKTLLQAHVGDAGDGGVSVSILPSAMSQLSRTPEGSAASHALLKHWIADCL